MACDDNIAEAIAKEACCCGWIAETHSKPG